MQLLSDSVFDIREYYGNMVLLYPEGHAGLVASLRERLDLSGYVYHCCPVGPSLLEKGHDVGEITALLDRCVCLVPVLNASVFEEENDVTRAMFWFLTGYMRARVQESVVPYIPDGEKVDLSGTPLQGIDIMFDPDTFIEKIPAKFAGKLLCYHYYESSTTNFYASRRITYRCLRLSFKIHEEAFRNALEYYNDTTGFSRSEYEFESYLDSAGVPDPELVIRPSGELRTSNFLPWQSAYSEYVFMDVLWPDFTGEHLDQAIEEFHRRNRRFGGV